MRKIFATIRKSSKYFAQQEIGKEGFPIAFPAKIDLEKDSVYCVFGNRNQYRLCDVNLWTEAADGEIKIVPMHGDYDDGTR